MRAVRLIIPFAALLCALMIERTRPLTRADVVCRGTAMGFECTVTNHKGGRTAYVSWDLRVQCRNGKVVRASASQYVVQDARLVHLIPLAELQGLTACDAGQNLTVENVTVRTVR